MSIYQAIKNFHTQFEFEPKIENADDLGQYDKYVVVGMGGSNLVTSLVNRWKPEWDIFIHRDYGLPFLPYRVQSKTLVVASSYSGNTEETIAGFEDAGKKKMARAVISTGGKLLELAKKEKVPYIEIPNTGIQPRSAAGFNFLALLRLMGADEEVAEARDLRLQLNPGDYEEAGRRLAKKIKGFVPLIYASSANEGLARNWKVRFNETGKIPAFYNVFPELNHNEMTGFDPIRALTAVHGQPISNGINSFEERKKLNSLFHFIFLKDEEDDSRIQKRMEITVELYKNRSLPVEVLKLEGKNHLLKIFSSIILADWTAYYTAQEYGVEAEQVPMVEEFKGLLQR